MLVGHGTRQRRGSTPTEKAKYERRGSRISAEEYRRALGGGGQRVEQGNKSSIEVNVLVFFVNCMRFFVVYMTGKVRRLDPTKKELLHALDSTPSRIDASRASPVAAQDNTRAVVALSPGGTSMASFRVHVAAAACVAKSSPRFRSWHSYPHHHRDCSPTGPVSPALGRSSNALICKFNDLGKIVATLKLKWENNGHAVFLTLTELKAIRGQPKLLQKLLYLVGGAVRVAKDE